MYILQLLLCVRECWNSLWKCHFQGYFTNGTYFPPQVTDRPHCPVGPSMEKSKVFETCWKIVWDLFLTAEFSVFNCKQGFLVPIDGH